MNKPATYVAAEPKKVTTFEDQNGRLHQDRDEAIAANFYSDLTDAILDVMNSQSIQGVVIDAARKLVTQFIAQHPDLTRVLLGDRDASDPLPTKESDR